MMIKRNRSEKSRGLNEMEVIEIMRLNEIEVIEIKWDVIVGEPQRS